MGWTRPQQLQTLGAANLQVWYDSLRKNKSENTAIGYLAHLRGFCVWLVEHGKMRENPALSVKRATGKPEPRKNVCSKETVRQLLDACVNPQLKFILYCGFHCGMRKGEIINASPDWFVLDKHGGGRVDIRIRPKGTLYATDPGWKPKSRKERSVPLTAEFRTFLESGAVPMDKRFVVEPTKIRTGRSAYRYDFRKPFQDLLATCGVKEVTAHDMRRTFASLRVMAGVSIVKIAKWIGDSHEVTHHHYSHLSPDKDKDIELGI